MSVAAAHPTSPSSSLLSTLGYATVPGVHPAISKKICVNDTRLKPFSGSHLSVIQTALQILVPTALCDLASWSTLASFLYLPPLLWAPALHGWSAVPLAQW